VLKVEKGDAVRLRGTSDEHGDRIAGYRLRAERSARRAVEPRSPTYATGRYPFEWHVVGAIAKTGAHHGPPLAALEVRRK